MTHTATAAGLYEEIGELTDYLSNVPDNLKLSGAFSGYEERLRLLKSEAAKRNIEALQLPITTIGEISSLPIELVPARIEELIETISRQEDLTRREALNRDRVQKMLGAGTLAGAAAASVAILALPILGVILAGSAATLAAASLGLDPRKRHSQEQEKLARLIAFRNELASLANRFAHRAVDDTEIGLFEERIVDILSSRDTFDTRQHARSQSSRLEHGNSIGHV